MNTISTRKDSKQTAVLNLLRDSKTELSTTQIADSLGISKSTINNHCNALREVGAIYMRKVPLGNGQCAKYYVISPAYNGSFEPTKKSKAVRVDRVEGMGTQRFIAQVPMSGQIGVGRFTCDKELTPLIAPKPYVPPRNNPNYTPSNTAFMTSGRWVNGVKA